MLSLLSQILLLNVALCWQSLTRHHLLTAHDLVDDVPEEVKMERANRIMEIQSTISYEKNKTKIGKSFKVLFDKIENGHFVGRTEGDSPEVDNEVLIPVKGNYVRLGDFAEVTITDASEYDLIGVLK